MRQFLRPPRQAAPAPCLLRFGGDHQGGGDTCHFYGFSLFSNCLAGSGIKRNERSYDFNASSKAVSKGFVPSAALRGFLLFDHLPRGPRGLAKCTVSQSAGGRQDRVGEGDRVKHLRILLVLLIRHAIGEI